jgi:hypothetical protein
VKKFFLILFIIPLFGFGLHKYYISLTKIDYIKEKEEVQITMRFFIDDVERVLNNRFKKEFELDTENELEKTDNYLSLYIRQKFTIQINDQDINYTFLGKEYDNDIMYIYLDITDIKEITSIEVINRMLFEEFPEQQNYIKLNINNTKKTFILIKDSDKEMLKF